MKMTICRMGLWTLAAAMVFAINGCGGGGGGSSTPASVTPPAPVVATQPQPAVVDDGAIATFSVTASGTAPFAYQWQRNGVAIAGATSATYTTAPLTPADTGALFSVVVSNSGGSLTSQAVALTVNALQPVIDIQPLVTSATVGSDVTLTVHSNGSQPQSYQWFRAGILIVGATSDTFKIASIAYADDGVGYSVQVSNSAATTPSAAAKMTVTPTSAPVAVAGCRDITAGGSYVLTADVGPNGNTSDCIAIHDTSGVQLDCQGHTITGSPTSFTGAISVQDVDNFSVKNCRFSVSFLYVTRGTSGTFSANSQSYTDTTWIPFFQVTDSKRFVFDNNTVAGVYTQIYGDGNTVSNNQISAPNRLSGAVLTSGFSVHTRLFSNTLDGGRDGNVITGGARNTAGADEGIILADESDALVENNQIQNVWDCGVESLGTLSYSTIRGNHIVRAGFCGIGGWYWSSVLGNTISFNKVENSGDLFQYMRDGAMRPAAWDNLKRMPADTMIYFKDNVFDGNELINPIGSNFGAQIPIYDNMGYNGSSRPVPGEVPPTASQFSYGNNLFKNNQFGLPAYAPWFGDQPGTPGLIVDGGGNVCQQPFAIYKNYPLKCN